MRLDVDDEGFSLPEVVQVAVWGLFIVQRLAFSGVRLCQTPIYIKVFSHFSANATHTRTHVWTGV